MSEARRIGVSAALLGMVVLGALAVWMLRRGDDSPELQPGSEPNAVEILPETGGELSVGSTAVEPQLSEERAEQLVEQTFMRADEVEPVAPESLAAFLPDSIKGLKRADTSSERSGVAGLDTAVAKARYFDQDHDVEVMVTDLAGPKGVAAFAAWALADDLHVVGPTGYEKVYRQRSRVHYATWFGDKSSGQQSVLLGGRIAVDVSGTADSDSALAAVLQSVDLDGIEKLVGR